MEGDRKPLKAKLGMRDPERSVIDFRLETQSSKLFLRTATAKIGPFPHSGPSVVKFWQHQIK